MAVRMFRDKYPQFDGIAVVPVSTPEFTGSMESGYALAVKAIIEDLVPAAQTVGSVPGRRRRQINELVGSHLTSGDLEHPKDLIELFGLRPVLVPDLSDSLDGHLPEEDISPLSVGGALVCDLATLGDSVATLVIGASLDVAAVVLEEKTGVPTIRFSDLMGLSRFALAADADLLVGFSELLASMGAETVAAVAPSNCRGLKRVRAKEVQIGDLEDLEIAA